MPGDLNDTELRLENLDNCVIVVADVCKTITADNCKNC